MNPKLLAILGGGAILYWWYSQKQAPVAAASPGASAPGTPAPAQSQPAPASSGGSQRAAIVAAINASGVSSTYIYGQQGVDTWNWYAMQAFPGWTAPAPETLYPGEPNVHSKTYTFDDWFKRIQPSLPGGGMSGYRPVTMSNYYGPGGWMA